MIQGEPSQTFQYGQSNGTMIKKTGGRKMVTKTYEVDGGEDEEEEIEETIIKKTKIIKKKKQKSTVSLTFVLCLLYVFIFV